MRYTNPRLLYFTLHQVSNWLSLLTYSSHMARLTRWTPQARVVKKQLVGSDVSLPRKFTQKSLHYFPAIWTPVGSKTSGTTTLLVPQWECLGTNSFSSHACRTTPNVQKSPAFIQFSSNFFEKNDTEHKEDIKYQKIQEGGRFAVLLTWRRPSKLELILTWLAFRLDFGGIGPVAMATFQVAVADHVEAEVTFVDGNGAMPPMMVANNCVLDTVRSTFTHSWHSRCPFRPTQALNQFLLQHLCHFSCFLKTFIAYDA